MTSCGKLFQSLLPATGIARSPMVTSRVGACVITDLWLYGGPWLRGTLAIAALGYGRHESAVLRPSGGVLRLSDRPHHWW